MACDFTDFSRYRYRSAGFAGASDTDGTGGAFRAHPVQGFGRKRGRQDRGCGVGQFSVSDPFFQMAAYRQ